MEIYYLQLWRVYPLGTAMLKIGSREKWGRGGLRQGKMKVTEKDVAHVADLANLELTEDERPLLLRDLNSILDYIDHLKQLDTADVPPMAQLFVNLAKDGGTPVASTTREDILEGLRKSLPQDVALQNAPDSDGTFFKVPKVIER